MTRNQVVVLILIMSISSGALLWMARGLYDRHLMLEGYFHVVNNSKKEHNIILTFPSSKKINFNLKASGVYDFKLTNTGEGSINVSVDGEKKDNVGYVTSMNSLIVLVIADNNINFSQVFTSLKLEAL